MTTRRVLSIGVLAAAWAVPAALGQYSTRTFNDPPDDAVIRRTDPGNDGPLNPAAVLPDLVSLTLSGWQPAAPAMDPYAGEAVTGAGADIFRLDLVLSGLVNPPGTLGLGATPFDPFAFGDSPLFGFIELDADDRKDTGGQLSGPAENRYLANVARFGAVPYGSIGERAALSGEDIDGDFYSGPYYERSGEDFAVVLCGCNPVTIVSQNGDMDSVFDAGETWIVRSRFFQRAAGYQGASCMFGGSDFGLYDPFVNLRFSHDTQTDLTTVSLVYALTPEGAAQLEGEAVQPVDCLLEVSGSHFSIEEGMRDLIDAADQGGLSGPTYVLTEDLEGRDYDDSLDPTDWRPMAIVGTSYLNQEETLFVWTDVGFDEEQGDFNGDGLVDPLDEAAFQVAVDAMDGGPGDADGTVNGEVVIPNFGTNFSVYDVNGDGLINSLDIGVEPGCPADWTGDSLVDSGDFFAFIQDFLAGDADFTGDTLTDSSDFFAFIQAFLGGC